MRSSALLLLALLSSCAAHDDRAALRTGPPGLGVADAALSIGSPDTALNVARGILAKSPRDAGALVRQGEALAQLGRTNEATDSFNKAIVSDPGATPAHLGLARLLLVRGDAARAEAELKLVIEQDSNDVRALVDVGIARDLLGRHEEAQSAYRQALSLSPGLAAARVNLGLSLALSGRSEDAVSTLRPLAEQPDSPPSVRHDFAVALALGGRTDEAERAMGRDLPTAEVRSTVALYRTIRDVGL